MGATAAAKAARKARRMAKAEAEVAESAMDLEEEFDPSILGLASNEVMEEAAKDHKDATGETGETMATEVAAEKAIPVAIKLVDPCSDLLRTLRESSARRVTPIRQSDPIEWDLMLEVLEEEKLDEKLDEKLVQRLLLTTDQMPALIMMKGLEDELEDKLDDQMENRTPEMEAYAIEPTSDEVEVNPKPNIDVEQSEESAHTPPEVKSNDFAIDGSNHTSVDPPQVGDDSSLDTRTAALSLPDPTLDLNLSADLTEDEGSTVLTDFHTDTETVSTFHEGGKTSSANRASQNRSSQKPKLILRKMRVRVPNSRYSRVRYRLSRAIDSVEDPLTCSIDAETSSEREDGNASDAAPVEFKPTPPTFLNDFHSQFGPEQYEALIQKAKEYSTTGSLLPDHVRDLIPALDDLSSAITMANSIRRHLDLPTLKMVKSNRIQILRTAAKTRESLYLSLITSLSLPLAPSPVQGTDTDNETDGTDDERVKISLTPTNLEFMQKTLPQVFPGEKSQIKKFLAEAGPGAYGEKGGKVAWTGGVGRVVGAEGGFRGKRQDGDVHVFVDHSNILYGLLHALYSNSSSSLPPKHLRTMSLPCLSLLLRRGRYTPPGTLHLVASSPLKQNLDDLVRLGWEVSVLKRVEIMSDEVEDPNALSLTPKPMDRIPAEHGATHSPERGVKESIGLRRYKEQGVDEILHLKVLQTLNQRPAVPAKGEPGYVKGKKAGTLVLATGDARGGQFNQDGFVGGVREALKRGWHVELWSFRAGMSRTWRDTAVREGWFQDGRFELYPMDQWAEQLVEVAESGQDELYQ